MRSVNDGDGSTPRLDSIAEQVRPGSLVVVDDASMLEPPTTFGILRSRLDGARLLLVEEPCLSIKKQGSMANPAWSVLGVIRQTTTNTFLHWVVHFQRNWSITLAPFAN